MWDVDIERNVTWVFKLFLLIISDSHAALRTAGAFSSEFISCTRTDKVERQWIIAWTVRAVKRSYHGLYRLSGPLPAVFLHRHLPRCSGPHPLLRGHLRSHQLLGFLRLLWTPHHLPQPGVLDLLVSGKPGGATGRVTPQMRLAASSFAEQRPFLTTGTEKWNRSCSYRCRSSN